MGVLLHHVLALSREECQHLVHHETGRTHVPTYQYVCTECGEPLEAVQSFSDDSLTECPACGGRLRKVYNAVGIVFKGSGFYRTDSRSGSTSSDPAAPASDKPAASSTEAAPAAAKATDSSSAAPSSGSGGSGSSGSSTSAA